MIEKQRASQEANIRLRNYLYLLLIIASSSAVFSVAVSVAIRNGKSMDDTTIITHLQANNTNLIDDGVQLIELGRRESGVTSEMAFSQGLITSELATLINRNSIYREDEQNSLTGDYLSFDMDMEKGLVVSVVNILENIVTPLIGDISTAILSTDGQYVAVTRLVRGDNHNYLNTIFKKTDDGQWVILKESDSIFNSQPNFSSGGKVIGYHRPNFAYVLEEVEGDVISVWEDFGAEENSNVVDLVPANSGNGVYYRRYTETSEGMEYSIYFRDNNGIETELVTDALLFYIVGDQDEYLVYRDKSNEVHVCLQGTDQTRNLGVVYSMEIIYNGEESFLLGLVRKGDALVRVHYPFADFFND